jgi:CubicO group peptidase (beta-lactamase class C family)
MVRGASPDEASGLTALLARPLSRETLAEIRHKLGTPGMAVGWHLSGNSQQVLADGGRARGWNAQVEPRDRWHIGSITKSFTATLFARAVDTGAIRWDTRLGQQLKDVPKAYARLTAIELLSHHGGLPTDIPMPELVALPRVEADPRATRRQYARIALAQRPVAAPRSKFAYSNVGYVLAAVMLEEATGLSWEALIRRELFDPLGISTAGFGPPGSLDNYLQPRGHSGGQPIFLDNPSAMAPAGGLHIGSYDLLTYLAAHRGKPAFLKPETWRELHTPRFGGRYALGWHVNSDGSLWHNGSNTAWYAEVTVEPTARLVTAVCANDTALITRHRLLLPAIRRAAGVTA